MDFEKGTVTVDNKEMRIKVNATKKYDTDRGWVVVIYTDLVDEGDKAELVWPEFGKAYVADEGEALMNLLQGLGTM